MIRKFYWCLLILVVSFSLCSCEPAETYDDGFRDGYHEGRWDALLDAEGKYEDRYNSGYEEGLYEFSNTFESAEAYALENSGCSPREAVDIIGIYLDPDNPLHSELEITEEEFHAAVNSLCFFYEYIRSERP